MNVKKTSLIIITILLCRLINAQAWSALGKGLSPFMGYGVFAMGIYNDNVIAGGVFFSTGTIPIYSEMARWNGTSWDSLGSEINRGWGGPNPSNCIWALTEYHNNLYIGGDFGQFDGLFAHSIVEWNGKLWDTLGPGLGPYNGSGFVYALTTYNDNLIAGGSFYNSGSNFSFNCIGMWNGKSWDTLGSGISGAIGVYALAVYNGNLYAGGLFTLAGGKPANNIAMWNGTSWSSTGSGINGKVYSLMAYNGNLYAGGEFDTAGGQPANNIAKWNGTSWSAVGRGMNNSNKNNESFVDALLEYNENLIAGGRFDSAGTQSADKLAVWNDTSWSALTDRKMNQYGTIYALTSYNGNLYIGGEFDSIGNLHTNYIAEYCPGSCLAHSNNDTISTNYDFRVYPNPGNGVFTFRWPAVNGQSMVVDIYNVLGQKIYNATLNEVQDDNTVNLGSYANGVYFYRVTTIAGAKIGAGKLVKQ
jgi:hypothetical protein